MVRRISRVVFWGRYEGPRPLNIPTSVYVQRQVAQRDKSRLLGTDLLIRHAEHRKYSRLGPSRYH